MGIKELQKALLECNIERQKLTDAFISGNGNDAIDLVKSALSIAIRKGEQTNWDSFEKRCITILQSSNKKFVLPEKVLQANNNLAEIDLQNLMKQESIDTVGKCANCGVEYHIHKIN